MVSIYCKQDHTTDATTKSTKVSVVTKHKTLLQHTDIIWLQIAVNNVNTAAPVVVQVIERFGQAVCKFERLQEGEFFQPALLVLVCAKMKIRDEVCMRQYI